MIPSEEEYLQAKNIVKLYENEQKRLYNIRALAFKEDFAKLWGSSNFQLLKYKNNTHPANEPFKWHEWARIILIVVIILYLILR